MQQQHSNFTATSFQTIMMLIHVGTPIFCHFVNNLCVYLPSLYHSQSKLSKGVTIIWSILFQTHCTDAFIDMKQQILLKEKHQSTNPSFFWSTTPASSFVASSDSRMSVWAWRNRLTKSCGDMKHSSFFLTLAYCKEKNRHQCKDPRWALESDRKGNKRKSNGKWKASLIRVRTQKRKTKKNT